MAMMIRDEVLILCASSLSLAGISPAGYREIPAFPVTRLCQTMFAIWDHTFVILQLRSMLFHHNIRMLQYLTESHQGRHVVISLQHYFEPTDFGISATLPMFLTLSF